MRTRFVLAAAGLAALLAACETASDKQIVGVDATGTAIGLVYVDRDGDGVLSSTDLVAPNIRITLTRSGAQRPSATALTDAKGIYRLAGIPVGSYRVGIDSTALGDSLQLVRIDSAAVMVAANDSVASIVTLGIRPLRLAAIRGEPAGKLVSVEGIALSASGTFADTTFHIADGTGALRITQLATNGLAVGDSIRVLGRTGTRSGQVVLVGTAAFRLGRTAPPAPVLLSTQLAARADGGKRDASLVRVRGTLITVDAATRDVKLTVNDGSGPVEVFLDHAAPISANGPLLPGVNVEAVGLLTPLEDGSARWRLRPRGTSDLNVEIPSSSVQAARKQPIGMLVSFTAVALNGWATYGDSTVHFSDPTGSVRAVRVPPAFIFAGDSVRVTGTIASLGAQPVVAGASVNVLGKAQIPQATSVSTGVAANASGARLDAALVKVHGTVRDSSVLISGGVIFSVDDESGPLTVFVAQNTGIGTGPWRIGDSIEITGLLVPFADGRSWYLKPRAREDLTR